MPRIPSDAAWADIVAKARRTLPADGDFNENANMVAEWDHGLGRSWHGCALHPKYHDRAESDVWICKMYFGGAQRVLCRGTLYQCARLYDAAQVFFSRYRTCRSAPTRFNFSSAQANDDQLHADFIHYFGAITDYFDNLGTPLPTAESRAEHSHLKTLDRQHSTRTYSGRIETRLTELETHSAEIKLRLNVIEQSLSTIATQLALLLHRSGGAVPLEPTASAELFNAARAHAFDQLVPIDKKDLTPIPASGSLSAQ